MSERNAHPRLSFLAGALLFTCSIPEACRRPEVLCAGVAAAALTSALTGARGTPTPGCVRNSRLDIKCCSKLASFRVKTWLRKVSKQSTGREGLGNSKAPWLADVDKFCSAQVLNGKCVGKTKVEQRAFGRTRLLGVDPHEGLVCPSKV